MSRIRYAKPSRALWLGLCLSGLFLLAGCEEPPIPFTEVKRIDEPITETEFQTVLKIVQSLPEEKLPALNSFWQPPPVWYSNRPVKYLLQLEREALEDRFSPARVALQLPHSRRFRRLLSEAHLTPEQFAGLITSLSVAYAREEIGDSVDLDKIIERGEVVLKGPQGLQNDERVFSMLSDDGAHRVLQDAAWLPLSDRAAKLRLVPTQNIELVRNHREQLQKFMPEALLQNPLAPLQHLMNESGLPFTETPESGSDTQLTWKPSEALLGDVESQGQ